MVESERDNSKFMQQRIYYSTSLNGDEDWTEEEEEEEEEEKEKEGRKEERTKERKKERKKSTFKRVSFFYCR